MDHSSLGKLFDLAVNARQHVQSAYALLDKQECTYDSSQGLHNSVDTVFPRTTPIQPGTVLAEKTIYVNLLTLQAVSKPYVALNQKLSLSDESHLDISNVPYVGITLQRVCAPLDIVRQRIQNYLSDVNNLSEGKSGGICIADSPSLFQLKYEYSLNIFNNDGTKRESLELRRSPIEWTDHDCSYASEIGIAKETLKVLAALCKSKSLDQADLLKSALSENECQFISELVIDQSTAPPVISMNPEQWCCDDCGQKTQNLWLNLSDGYVGCGRKQYGIAKDGCGCANGQEGAAIRHYETHPEYHVCVKLGTISPVSADVYSYKYDTMVIDDQLDAHLKRFGLRRTQMTQSSQTTAQLAAEKNEALKFGLDEQGLNACGKRLRPSTARIGIINIGNSCYMATILHLLSMIYYDEISDRSPNAVDVLKEIWQSKTSREERRTMLVPQIHRQIVPLVGEIDGMNEYFKAQDDMYSTYVRLLQESGVPEADIVRCIGSIDDYWQAADPKLRLGIIAPTHLKLATARKNRLFGTSEQQDAEEFLQFLFDTLPGEETRLFGSSKLREKMELRIVSQSNHSTDPVLVSTPILSLQVPIQAEDILQLSGLVSEWHQGDGKSWIAHYPPHLMIKLQRITSDSQGNISKLSHRISIPDVLDLSHVRVSEEILKKALAAPPPAAHIVPNHIRDSLKTDMGFSDEQINAAAAHLGTNADCPEMMIDWILSNPDAVMPTDTAESNIDAAALDNIMNLGFERAQAQRALKRFKNDVNAAVEALLTAPANDDEEEEAVTRNDVSPYECTKCTYSLEGVVIHVGSNTHCGHYVVYLKKNLTWLMFNDETVISVEPDKLNFDGAYLCLYRRNH